MLKLHEITQNDSDIIRLAKEDPRVIIENFFTIIDKDGELVPFKFNPAQDKYYRNRTSRDDILKARKEGFSSLILALLTVKFLFLENINCVCISHEDDSTQRLLNRVKSYIDNLTYKGEQIEVDISDRSRKRLKYARRNNTFYIGTAGSRAFGRGDDIHFLHVSEVAFWDNASNILTGLLNAVPDNLEKTYIVKESTANGFGTFHHAEWQNEKAGKSIFKPHFFGWNEDPTNTMLVPEDFVPTAEEQKIKTKYQLSGEQLSWRRYKISSMQGDPRKNLTKDDLFKQEFPITPEEAFISTGKPAFEMSTISWYKEVHAKSATLIGNLHGWRPPIFIPHSDGFLSIWEEPKPEEVYVIGADVAKDGDYSYACVIKRSTFEQVAEWHAHAEEFEFASVLHRLGIYYNEALLGIEKNNQGVAVVNKVDELGYTNQYRRRSLDSISGKVYDDLGWRTDTGTRPKLIMDFQQATSNRQFIIRSELLLDQMRTFIRTTSKTEAAPNCYDDAVIGAGIAIQMYKFIPEPIKDSDIVTRDYRPSTSLYNLLRK
jgi:hypothetical protein